MKLRVLVGRDKIIKEFVINTLHDSFGNPIFPEFDDTGRFISFMDSIQGVNTVLSIHDFLLEFNINLDINTEVHYVGYTKNPHTRPLNGVHGGLTSTLCNVSNEENDILIFFNIFKVMCLAKNKKLNFEFFSANSMTDEINVDQEGFILEKSLIFYFDAKNQNKDKERERSEIVNNLKKIRDQHDINCVQIYYEVDSESEYYRFFSSKIPPDSRHLFTVKLDDDKLSVINGAPQFEAALASS
jgi:hypothetical protein